MPTPRRTRIIIALLAAASLAAAAAPAPASAKSHDARLAARIDAIMRKAYPDDQPGAAILVARGGDVILRRGYGLADLEQRIPVAPDMVFRIGSLTKQFTAVAVMMLAEEGALALEDTIGDHLPDYPEPGRAVTIEQLLTHTSGIPSYTDQPRYLAMMREDCTVQDLIARFAHEPLEFAPGTRWSYSNSGYVLLGAIIESVAGRSWADVLAGRVFTAADLTDTYADDHERIVPRRVRGYDPDPREPGTWRNAAYLSMTQPYAAGGMLATVDDLARWDAALTSGRLIGRRSLERAWTDAVLADGRRTGYGYGWLVGEWLGSRVVHHGGGINGFRCEAIHCPDERVFVAVLTNRSGPPGPAVAAREAAALAMGKPWNPVEVAVDPDVLERYVGVYRIDERSTRTVTVEDGVLFTQRSGSAALRARPMSPTAFFYDGSLSHFTIELDPDGAVRGMTMRAMGARPAFAALTDEEPSVRQAISLDPQTLDRYLGRYELAPAFVLTVTREGDRLFAQATGQPRLAIRPETPQRFFVEGVDAELEFAFDQDGRSTGLTLLQAGQRIVARRLAD